jgi:hypothetical protein
MDTSITSIFELIHLLTQTNLYNTNHVNHQPIPKGCLLPNDIIVTADLSNMYNNINVKLAIEFIIQALTTYREEYHMFGNSQQENINTWKTILSYSLAHAIFRFEDNIIQQTYGVPMGSPVGPLIAIIFINTIIKNNLATMNPIHNPFIVAKMYIDDGFFILRNINKTQVTDILNKLISWPENSVSWDQDSIQIYTAEELQFSTISFLDASISSTKEQHQNLSIYRLTSGLYTKPLGTYQYVHWRSAHPKAMKRAVIRGELNRRIRICSTIQQWNIAKEDLKHKLINRRYPLPEIQQQESNFPFHKSRPLLNRTVAKIRRNKKRSINPYSPTYSNKHKTQNILPLTIRYDPRHHRELTRIRAHLQTKVDSISNTNCSNNKRVVLAYKKNRKSQIISILRSNP